MHPWLMLPQRLATLLNDLVHNRRFVGINLEIGSGLRVLMSVSVFILLILLNVLFILSDADFH